MVYSIEYKLKTLVELKKNERFLPFVEDLQKEWLNDNVPIEYFMLKHFEYIVDNFEISEFLNNSDDDTINKVISDAMKDLDKLFN